MLQIILNHISLSSHKCSKTTSTVKQTYEGMTTS